MKKIFFSTCMIFLTMISFAQNNREEVYLKNGSIIKGVIVEEVLNQSVKIQTADGSLFVYGMGEIEKIVRSPQETMNEKNSCLNSLFLDTYNITGYRGFFELGFTGGLGDYGVGRPELLTSHGAQINPYLFVGAGTGVQYYCTNGADAFNFPLFADVKVNFKKGGIVPFGGLKIGYAFCGTNDFESVGFYLAPSVGMKFMLSDRKAVNVSLGYTLQNVKAYTDYYEYIYDKSGYSTHYYSTSSTENLGGISFKLGFEF